MASSLIFALFVWLVPLSVTKNVQESNSSDVSAVLTDTKNAEFFRFIFQGLPGRDGRDGRDGHDGHDGSDGNTGLPGPAGAPGINTVSAISPGPMGPPGLSSRNARSIAGPQGPRGFSGRPGKQGPSGMDGNAGLRGQIGIPGPRGSPGPAGLPGSNAGTSGAVYVRWGRTTCPSVSELAYAGIAGGKWYDHQGSGSNYLCLPKDPEYDDYQAGVQTTSRAFVYSAEYETSDFPPYADKYQHDVTCAVCRTSNRGSALMIPAKITCPSGWTREYHGYLMAEYDSNHHSTEFVCVDRNPEILAGSFANQNGALFYPVEGRCDTGNLPCAPYISGAELTCVVCSK